MKKVAIVGNALAGFEVAKNLIANTSDYEITFFPFDNLWPVEQEGYGQFVQKKIKLKDLQRETQEFMSSKSIHVISDQEISRINIKNRKIYTPERKQFEFDVICLTELPRQKFYEIQGSKKDGVYGIRRLQDMIKIQKEVLQLEAAAIQGRGIDSLMIASALAATHMDVDMLSPDDNDFWNLFSHDALSEIKVQLEQNKIRLIRGHEISEVLGDAAAKAIRLKTGKIIATDMILFEDINFDYRVISDQELIAEERILVQENYKVAEGVYAFGYLAQEANLFSSARTQARRQACEVCSDILDQSLNSPETLERRDVTCGPMHFTLLGNVGLHQDGAIKDVLEKDPLRYGRLFIRDKKIFGAVLVNNSERADSILDAIVEAKEIEDFSTVLPEPSLTGATSEGIFSKDDHTL